MQAGAAGIGAAVTAATGRTGGDPKGTGAIDADWTGGIDWAAAAGIVAGVGAALAISPGM